MVFDTLSSERVLKLWAEIQQDRDRTPVLENISGRYRANSTVFEAIRATLSTLATIWIDSDQFWAKLLRIQNHRSLKSRALDVGSPYE